MGLKPILFGFPRSVVKATMVIIYVYKGARKLPSANYPPFSFTRLPNQNGLSKIQVQKNPNVTLPSCLTTSIIYIGPALDININI